MGERDYRLYNWKEHPDGKQITLNWYGEELDDDELNKLRVGDCVRLMLVDIESDGRFWEKIYFEITKINYYNRGSKNIPRTFFGKAMDTYRYYPDGNEAFVKTGDIISFQKKNIIELPKWNADTPYQQANLKQVDIHLDYLYKHRFDDNDD